MKRADKKGGRPRTGSLEPFKRASGAIYFRARIRLADGARERVDVPDKHCRPAGGLTGEERAELYVLAAQEDEDRTSRLLAAKKEREARRAASEDPRNGETCSQYRVRLEAYRTELGRRTIRHEQSAWRRWIDPTIGARTIKDVTREEIERVRDALDDAITAHKKTAGKEGIGAKRARNVWTVVTLTFKAAAQSKRRDLRVRPGDNPTLGVLPPERGDSRQRTFIYPNEMSKLLACVDVPLDWRETYALAAYLYLRPGELRVLTVGDVDLDAGVVHITKAWDEDAKEEKAPKTRTGVRDVPIHPSLRPLLERLMKNKPRATLLAPIMRARCSFERARVLRAHLAKANINRARLTENSATAMHVGFRSLRDTGITWLALAGVDVVKMQRRAGHEDPTTTLGYVKAAEDISGSIGAPFPELPTSLVSPDQWAKQWPKSSTPGESHQENGSDVASPGGFENRETLANKVFHENSERQNPIRVELTPREPVAVGPSAEYTQSVEDALATAIADASKAGRWDVVAQLARELEARRLAAADIVAIDPKRRRSPP